MKVQRIIIIIVIVIVTDFVTGASPGRHRVCPRVVIGWSSGSPSNTIIIIFYFFYFFIIIITTTTGMTKA
jgi:hypothetical protein